VPTPEGPVRETPTLLVVEDDRLLRWSLHEKLTAAGWEVIEAASGFAALEAAARRSIVLALVAVSLPDLDGAALAVQLASEHPECRIILMASAERPEAVAPRPGGWPVLEKPFDLDEIVRWAGPTGPRSG